MLSERCLAVITFRAAAADEDDDIQSVGASVLRRLLCILTKVSTHGLVREENLLVLIVGLSSLECLADKSALCRHRRYAKCFVDFRSPQASHHSVHPSSPRRNTQVYFACSYNNTY